jgi:hypothetical protein
MMTAENKTILVDLIRQCNDLTIKNARKIDYDRMEFVIDYSEFAQWVGKFNALLGPAIKPSGVEPSAMHKKLTQDYGGITEYQTLYSKEVNGITVVAMFWPWGDKTSQTLHLYMYLTPKGTSA